MARRCRCATNLSCWGGLRQNTLMNRSIHEYYALVLLTVGPGSSARYSCHSPATFPKWWSLEANTSDGSAVRNKYAGIFAGRWFPSVDASESAAVLVTIVVTAVVVCFGADLGLRSLSAQLESLSDDTQVRSRQGHSRYPPTHARTHPLGASSGRSAISSALTARSC